MDYIMNVTVIDTCCLINLYASQRPLALIQAVFRKIIIPNHVAEESLFIRQPADDDPTQLVPVAISLGELLEKAVIEVVDFNEDAELEQFIQLATLLDDGEAACMAIASLRGLPLSTDDRKAITVANDLDVEILTTPEILKNWIIAVSPEPGEITEVVDNIERYGRFRPHHTSVHAKWWMDNSSWSR